MRVTAKMIAEQLNLSPATVDRVLNNRKGVSEKTINRVKEKAKELGYKPNKAAKFLSTQKIVKVVFVLPYHPNYFWKDIEHELRLAALYYEDFGFVIDIQRFEFKSEQINFLNKIIESKEYNAIVTSPLYESNSVVSIINDAIDKGIPVFTLSNDVLNSKRLAFIGSDYFDSGYLAGELITLLSKNINETVLVKDKNKSDQMIEKEKGFRKYLKEWEIDTDIKEIPVNTHNVEEELPNYEEILLGADAIYVASGVLGKTADLLYKNNWIKAETTLIGHDIDQTIYTLLQKGIIKATICQDPRAQANITIKKVFDYLFSEDKAKQRFLLEDEIMKLEVVTRANSKYYLRTELNKK